MQFSSADAPSSPLFGEEEKKHQTSPDSSPMFSEEEVETWFSQVSDLETFEVSA